MRRFSYLAILPSIFANLCDAQDPDLSTVSITAAPDYVVQQSCVKNALYDEFLSEEFLGLPLSLGCTGTVYNACYCATAVQGEVSSFVHGAVSENCGGTSQISEALSVYDDYCSSAGYVFAASTTANGAASASTGSAKNSRTQSNNANSQTSTPTNGGAAPTSSSSSDSPSSTNQTKSKSNPNIGAIIGGTLGGLALIAIILLLILLIVRNKSPKPAVDAPPPTTVNTNTTPAGGMAYGGRAELEKNEIKNNPTIIAQPVYVSPVSTERVENVNTYGLRPEEMDAHGRSIAQLHGDGRYPGNAGVELPGNERFGTH